MHTCESGRTVVDMTKTAQLDLARAKSVQTNKRRKQNRLAGELRAEGWKTIPPESQDALGELLRFLMLLRENQGHGCKRPGIQIDTYCPRCVIDATWDRLREAHLVPEPIRPADLQAAIALLEQAGWAAQPVGGVA